MSKDKLKSENHTSHFALHTSSKGITLIALIITIIVMLLLTGVVLSVALGDNGIVNNAKEATAKTEEQEVFEKLLGCAIFNNLGEIEVNKTYESAKLLFENEGKTVNLITSTELTDNIAIIKLEIIGKFGTYRYKIATKEITKVDNFTNEFEFSVYKNNRGNAVEIRINPTIPESWDPVCTREEALQFMEIMFKEEGLIGENETITSLEQIDVIVYNYFSDIEGYPFYDETGTNVTNLAGVIEKLGLNIDTNSSTADEEVTEYLLTILEFGYTTIEEWATDIIGLEYEAQTKKILLNGKELTEGVTWDGHNATFIIEENGTYDIQVFLDDKSAIEPFEITDIRYFELGVTQTKNSFTELIPTTISITLNIDVNVPSYWYNPNFIEEAKTKIIKVNGEELKEGVDWDEKKATFTTYENGAYEIEVEIDGRVIEQPIQITDIDENRHVGKYVKYDSDGDGSVKDEILYRVLYEENELAEEAGEETGAQIIADYILDDVTITLGYEDETIDRDSLTDINEDGSLDCEHAYASVMNSTNKILNKYNEWYEDVKKDGITNDCRCTGTYAIEPYDIIDFGLHQYGYPFRTTGYTNGGVYDGDRIMNSLGKYELDYWIPYNTGLTPYGRMEYYIAKSYVLTSKQGYVGTESSDFISVQLNSPNSTYTDCNNITRGIRPIIILEPGVLGRSVQKGKGLTADDPIILK